MNFALEDFPNRQICPLSDIFSYLIFPDSLSGERHKK